MSCCASSLSEALDKAGWAYVLYYLILLNENVCGTNACGFQGLS